MAFNDVSKQIDLNKGELFQWLDLVEEGRLFDEKYKENAFSRAQSVFLGIEKGQLEALTAVATYFSENQSGDISIGTAIKVSTSSIKAALQSSNTLGFRFDGIPAPIYEKLQEVSELLFSVERVEEEEWKMLYPLIISENGEGTYQSFQPAFIKNEFPVEARAVQTIFMKKVIMAIDNYHQRYFRQPKIFDTWLKKLILHLSDIKIRRPYAIKLFGNIKQSEKNQGSLSVQILKVPLSEVIESLWATLTTCINLINQELDNSLLANTQLDKTKAENILTYVNSLIGQEIRRRELALKEINFATQIIKERRQIEKGSNFLQKLVETRADKIESEKKRNRIIESYKDATRKYVELGDELHAMVAPKTPWAKN